MEIIASLEVANDGRRGIDADFLFIGFLSYNLDYYHWHLELARFL